MSTRPYELMMTAWGCCKTDRNHADGLVTSIPSSSLPESPMYDGTSCASYCSQRGRDPGWRFQETLCRISNPGRTKSLGRAETEPVSRVCGVGRCCLEIKEAYEEEEEAERSEKAKQIEKDKEAGL